MCCANYLLRVVGVTFLSMSKPWRIGSHYATFSAHAFATFFFTFPFTRFLVNIRVKLSLLRLPIFSNQFLVTGSYVKPHTTARIAPQAARYLMWCSFLPTLKPCRYEMFKSHSETVLVLGPPQMRYLHLGRSGGCSVALWLPSREHTKENRFSSSSRTGTDWQIDIFFAFSLVVFFVVIKDPTVKIRCVIKCVSVCRISFCVEPRSIWLVSRALKIDLSWRISICEKWIPHVI